MIDRYHPFRLPEDEARKFEKLAEKIDANLSWLFRELIRHGATQVSVKALKLAAKADPLSIRRNKKEA